MSKDNFYEPWPQLPYEDFKSTLHLLHMGSQAMGKLKLTQPFEPHWAGVVLWLTSRGFTTGAINYQHGAYSVEMDFIEHQVICKTSFGKEGKFDLKNMSVDGLISVLFDTLDKIGLKVSINTMPVEVPKPVAFHEDIVVRSYNPILAQRCWRIMLNIQRIMQRYHVKFTGITPPIGLMWGTFDLRDVRYKGTPLPIAGSSLDFIRRNAMDDAQIETGWWCGNDLYPRPAFFGFTYPPPPGIEQAKIKPAAAHWDTSLKEFILDYDDLLKANDPDGDLLSFFESTYEAGAQLANWDIKLNSSGKPV